MSLMGTMRAGPKRCRIDGQSRSPTSIRHGAAWGSPTGEPRLTLSWPLQGRVMNRPEFRLAFHLTTLCLVAALVAACAATSVKQSGKSPDFQGPLGRTAVLAVVQRGDFRTGLENRLAQALEARGTSVRTTYDVLPLDVIRQDKHAAADRLSAEGVEALLILRLRDRSSSYREYRSGDGRWAPVLGGVETVGWYDFYNIGFMDMGATYGAARDVISLEFVVFDLRSEKPVWSGITETYVTDATDRLAEVDHIVAKMIAAMRKDGVVP